ncbi:MAG: FtsK/SpoIIIE domain-containing protein [Phycisphaerales bacterium]
MPDPTTAANAKRDAATPDAERTGHAKPGARQSAIVREFRRDIEERQHAETAANREDKQTRSRTDEEYEEAVQRITRVRDEAVAAADAIYEQRVKAIAAEFESARGKAKRDAEAIRAKVGGELEAEERHAARALKEKIWAAETVFEANQNKPEAEYQQTKKQIEKKLNDLVATETLAGTLLTEYGQPIGPGDLDAAGKVIEEEPSSDPAAEFDRRAESAAGLTTALDRAGLPRMVKHGTLIVLAIIFVVGMTALAAWSQQWKFDAIVGVAAGATVVFAATGVWALSRVAKRTIGRIREPLIIELVGARQSAERWLAVAGARRDAHSRSLADARDEEVLRAKEKHEPVIADVKRRRAEETARLQEQYAAIRAAIDRKREQESAGATAQRRRATSEAVAAYERDMAATEERAASTRDSSASKRESRFAALASAWRAGDERAREAARRLWEEVAGSFVGWDDPSWGGWTPPVAPATHLGIGRFLLDRREVPGGEPSDPRLALDSAPVLEIPATLALPDQCSLVLKYPGVEGAGRGVALRTLQAVMIRILTSLPPGKARFIIFDPVGLGENFAGFMHLADHDEALVGGKIWTEARHFEQRLTDLTEHMENVIQKYLRNEFRTIAEYNEQAGEIAEPYRFLVIADFPAAFNEASFSRLASVVNSGARCGVHTLISLDTRHVLPPGASLADIEKNSVRLIWRRPTPPTSPAGAGAAPAPEAPKKSASHRLGALAPVGGVRAADAASAPNGKREDENGLSGSGAHEAAPAGEPRLVWEDADLAVVPLALDEPPGEELFNRLIHEIGAGAKRSSRVQVPFSTISPEPEEFWTLDSAEELRVPLGRAGATKLQYLTLGRGTSQHALIAGKTGSGKSTLLNAIVTNLSMWYSPEQVQFYLIDFKKGVEFKSYATHELAHARAVAIESDREFGLSVLQRLDNELKRRGNLFRDLGVQDLRGFRARQPGTAMPRILLIIDEFQEFFTEDDKLSQDATLLLDRLVRQGRAFGMHVILGSQTLSGAYSLARSTMGQMAVRIALQCSEADSYVILNEDNAAARLLSRPGEAIYNDQSGLVEGNSPFQIAWLPDDQREEYLRRVDAMTRASGYRVAERQAVFEGNVPADISRNLPLANLLEASGAGTDQAGAGSSSLRVWLGDAIAIKDPTAAVLRRQAGSNIVIVGQREETAAALLAAAMIGISAQVPAPGAPGSDSPTFYLLDPTPPDSPLLGVLESVGSRLPRGHSGRGVGMKAVAEALAELSAEMKRRQESQDASSHGTSGGVKAPPLFLVINGIQKYRVLRRPEDDFSFSMDADKAPSPDRMLGEILREGPGVGIHVMIWCDTAPNLTRALDRQGLREFDYRVLMQMSQADSASLIDTPEAGKLGMHRALLHSEEQGYSEKFRPYALPGEEWMRQFRA